MNQTIKQIADKNALRFAYKDDNGSFNINVVRYENKYKDYVDYAYIERIEYKYYLYISDMSYIYRGNLISLGRTSLSYSFYPTEGNKIYLSDNRETITPGFNKVLLQILGDFVIPHLESVNYKEVLTAYHITSDINAVKRYIEDKKKELEKLEGELVEKSSLETEQVKEYIKKLEEGTL